MAASYPMKDPKTGLQETAYSGFSWTSLFFGALPAFFRGDFLRGVVGWAIFIVISIGSGGLLLPVAWLIWAFVYNRMHARSLIKDGFIFDGSPEQNAIAARTFGVSARTAEPAR